MTFVSFFVSRETLDLFLKIVYIYIGTTFILESGQSWKTAALRVPKCVCFFVSCETFLVDGEFMQQKYIKIALEEAKKAYEKGEIPIGAVIVKNNQVISSSHNLKETLGCATRHAEIIAIEKASEVINDWRLNECEMYVTMEPCIMCCGALIQSRINKVYYILDNSKFGGIGGMNRILENNHNNHIVQIEKINDFTLESKYKQILKEFFSDKR